MSARSPHEALTERQKEICQYAGAFGILLTLTCLIQHLVVARSVWLSYVMLIAYVMALVSFLLLALLKHIAPWMVIVSGVLAIGLQMIWMMSGLFSLTVLMLFIYHVIIIVMLFTEQIPARLNEKRRLEIQEEMEWYSKLGS